MTANLAYGMALEALDIVLVDDNRGTQSVLRSIIAQMHIKRLRVYESAETALQEIVNDPPSVLIAEWRMKPMSGYRLLRALRDRSMTPLCFLPVLVVTAVPTVTMVDKAFSIGANNVLIMPLSPVALRERLQWLCTDPREFILKRGRYVLDGIEEALEQRVRGNVFGTMLEHRHAADSSLARRAEQAQDLVDRIVSGDVDPETIPPEILSPEDAPANWNGWTMK